FLRDDCGGAVCFAPVSDRIGGGRLSSARPSGHDDPVCMSLHRNCRHRHRIRAPQQCDCTLYHAGGAPGVLLLEQVQAIQFMRHKHSDYMHWSKTQSRARFNLATSGVAAYPLRELPVDLEKLEINGE